MQQSYGAPVGVMLRGRAAAEQLISCATAERGQSHQQVSCCKLVCVGVSSWVEGDSLVTFRFGFDNKMGRRKERTKTARWPALALGNERKLAKETFRNELYEDPDSPCNTAEPIPETFSCGHAAQTEPAFTVEAALLIYGCSVLDISNVN